MEETNSVKMIREIRRKLLEEEKRLGREEYLRRQKKRVEDFLRGTPVEMVPPRGRRRDE